MLKRLGTWLVVVLVVAGLAGPALAQKPVKIGVLTPLSPPGDASAGQFIVRGAKMGAEDVNARGGVLGGRKIELVVEDDGLTQIYMKTILARHFEVLVAGSGAEARTHLADRPKDVRIVLMDLSLKGQEDGLALTRYLRSEERWRALPIIATTAHAFAEDRRNALSAGCDAYLAKPIEPAQLLAIIRKFLPDAVGESRAKA